MPPALSAYFEIVRFGAALVVLLQHAWLVLFPDFPLPWPGHQAVIVFFVLSGYVISHAADTKDKTLESYVLSRASRLLCVTVPALLLGAIVAIDQGMPSSNVAQALFLNAVFLGQSWNYTVMAPANGPYWSLCYEVWYYAMFAAATFAVGRTRLVWILLTGAMAGPKILLLMPSWLLGVVLHKNIRSFRPGNTEAAILFIVSVVLYLAFFWFDVSVGIRKEMSAVAPDFVYYLTGSNQFVGDTILALIVSLNFIAVAKLQGSKAELVAKTKRVAAWFAGTTLSLYLFHSPVLEVVSRNGYPRIAALLLTMAIPFCLAFVTEHQKKPLRRVLESVWNAARVGATARQMKVTNPERE